MKNVYKESTITELVGTLDIDMNNDLIVFVEGGKDEPPAQYHLLDLLESHKGEQISLKLLDERVI